VVLAEEADIDEVFTLDMRGFQAYWIHGRKLFKIWRDRTFLLCLDTF